MLFGMMIVIMIVFCILLIFEIFNRHLLCLNFRKYRNMYTVENDKKISSFVHVFFIRTFKFQLRLDVLIVQINFSLKRFH